MLERTPLQPLARLALVRRLEGTYTVELDRVSAAWLASAELRAGEAVDAEPRPAWPRQRRAGRALAAELGERLRLGCPVRPPRQAAMASRSLRAGDRMSTSSAPCWRCRCPWRWTLVPALRERASYARLRWGVASKLHVPLATPAAPAAVQGLEAAFWTWTASAPGAGPATFASSFAGGARADASARVRLGPERWRSAVRRSAARALADRRRRDHALGRADARPRGAYACHPPGWSPRDDEEVAAPHGRIHLAGEHTAAEFCGTLEGALRSGARAAAEVLAERAQTAIAPLTNVRSAI